MRALLEPIGQIRLGHLLLAGLTLFVLGVMVGLFSGSAGAAFSAAAFAVWLAAVARFALDRTEGRPEHYRVAATALPGGIALAFALAAVVAGAHTVGIGTPSGSNGGIVEEVAGESATPAASSAGATASPTDTAAPTPTGSPTATDTPAASPTDSPTPEPTPPPKPDQPSGPITIASVTVTSPVGRGDTATATAQVDPGVACSIRVPYVTGSRAGLAAQVVPASGTVSWSWTISHHARRGLAAVTVFCRDSDSTAWQTTTFVIA